MQMESEVAGGSFWFFDVFTLCILDFYLNSCSQTIGNRILYTSPRV